MLPRYQDSHERAVFKAAAMVKETKHILAVLDQQGLSDLRSMQKPDSDVEDVLASVIIISMFTIIDMQPKSYNRATQIPQ